MRTQIKMNLEMKATLTHVGDISLCLLLTLSSETGLFQVGLSTCCTILSASLPTLFSYEGLKMVTRNNLCHH